MTREEMEKLKCGDIVRHKHGSTSYVVTSNYRSTSYVVTSNSMTGVVAVASVHLTNFDEWLLIREKKE